MTAFTIGGSEPWGIPLNETFLPELMKAQGYATAAFGKWHLGFFKPGYTPTRRGFDQDEGLFQAAGDHYEHMPMVGGYDWHVNDEIDFSARCAWYCLQTLREHSMCS